MKTETENNASELNNYSFCLFRLPEEGGRVLWEITNSCNYSCNYCIFSAERGRIPGELTTEEAFEVLEGLKSRGFTHIKFTGGEPFIRRDMLDILRRSRDLEFIVDISTNASRITGDMASELNEIGLNMVHVSVDGHNRELHERARGQNTYLPTIRGLKYLVDSDAYVRIGTVIFKGNEKYLEEMVQSGASLGADEIIFSYMEPVGRSKDDYSLISNKPIEEVKDALEQLAQKYQDKIKVNYSFTEKPKQCESGICPAVNKFLYIDNLGRISPCTWVVEKYPQYRTEKTVKTASFEEVMDSEPIKSYLSYIEHNKIRGCPVSRR